MFKKKNIETKHTRHIESYEPVSNRWMTLVQNQVWLSKFLEHLPERKCFQIQYNIALTAMRMLLQTFAFSHENKIRSTSNFDWEFDCEGRTKQVFISTKSIHHEQEVSKQIPGSLICFYKLKTAVHYNNYCTQLTPWQIVPIVLHEMELEITLYFWWNSTISWWTGIWGQNMLVAKWSHCVFVVLDWHGKVRVEKRFVISFPLVSDIVSFSVWYSVNLRHLRFFFSVGQPIRTSLENAVPSFAGKF